MRRGGSYRRTEHEGEQGFWPSYADMMSSVALILFFLMLLSYIQNLVTGNDLQNTQEVLADTKLQVQQAEDELAKLSDELELQESQIQLYALQIQQQTEELSAQQQLIGQQDAYLMAANDELQEMRSQMQTIAVLRLSILEQIREGIVEVMGDADKVSIGDNGNIILSDSVLFDTGSSQIRPESGQVLDELIDVFYRFLGDGENAKYVDSIVISGHTDTVGDAESNRRLSTDRANSVLNYLLMGREGRLDRFSPYFCAAGYGQTRPVASNDSDEGKAQNRRIEISMILKDETVLEIVESYLALEVPGEMQEVAPPTPTVTPQPTPAQENKGHGLFGLF